MLFTNRAIRVLFEAVEDAGFAREELTRPLGLDPAQLLADGRAVEWTTMVELGSQLSTLLDDDHERLRAMGRRMLHVQTLRPLKSIAKSVVSVRAFFEISVRWVFTALLPHLELSLGGISPTRLAIHLEIPEPLAAHRSFFPVFEGAIEAMPELIGHPPAVIVERAVTLRTLDLVVDHDDRPSIFTRTRRRVDALLRAPRMFAVLEGQRQELAQNIRALQSARDELRLVLERLPDFVAIHTDGKILWVNRALSSGLGYADGSEVVGMPVIDLVAPQDRANATAALARPIDPSHARLREWSLRAKCGQEVMVELAPMQSVVFDGIPAKLIVGRDVTERVRMQQKLIVADRLASVGLLAAGVAHEVNNPLGYILNNIELAAKEVGSDDRATERRRAVLATALEGVDRIRVIVRDLLRLSRGDDGPLGPIDLAVVTASTLSLAAPEIERHARLVYDFQAAPVVLASSARISQILLNLVGNALEAMAGLDKDECELAIRVEHAEGGRVLLEVSDTGNGISEGDLPRVFEPFYTTKPAGKGTGLGLAIAQKIVVELGGEIGVRSTVGRGTTFRVLLPSAVTSSASAVDCIDGCSGGLTHDLLRAEP